MAQPEPQPFPQICGSAYQSCWESHCCQDGLACYKKMGADIAQCRPQVNGCTDNDEWRCPGWELCSIESCTQTLCCQDDRLQCFKRATGMDARCRVGQLPCIDGPDWLCPGWELCSKAYEDCSSTLCCDHADYACAVFSPLFSGKFAPDFDWDPAYMDYPRCVPRSHCDKKNGHHCSVIQPTMGICAGMGQNCFATGCCSHPLEHCYAKDHKEALCRPKCDSSHYDTYKWACTKREIPSEKFKLSCADLRARDYVEYPSCDVEYEGCKSAYVSFGSIDVDGIKLCGWDWSRSMCVEKGEVHYGCELPRGTFDKDTRKTDNSPLSFQLGSSHISLTPLQVGLLAVIVVLLSFICWSGSREVQPCNGHAHGRVPINTTPSNTRIRATQGKSKSWHKMPFLVSSPPTRKIGSKNRNFHVRQGSGLTPPPCVAGV